MREFVAGLQDGHAFVRWTGKVDRPFRRWPFTVVDTTEGLMVDELLPTWTNAPVDVARGDLLLEVDDVPVARRVEEVERRTNASTSGSRRRWALPRVAFNRSDPSRYKVRRADGVAYVRIPTFEFAYQTAWAAARPDERPALLAKDAAAIRAAFASADGCRALVLDLRGNGGGTDLLGMEVAACLLPAGFVYYGLASRGLFGGWASPGFHRPRVEGTPPRFAGQLVVLIDEDVFSVSDNLCRCLDDLHGDVIFVGRATGGGTGAPRSCVTLEHSGAVVGFCTMRVVGPQGELIEGRGTKPDVSVQPTRAAVLAGRDQDLEAALDAIR